MSQPFCSGKTTWSLQCGNLQPSNWTPFPEFSQCGENYTPSKQPQPNYNIKENYAPVKSVWVTQKPYTL